MSRQCVTTEPSAYVEVDLVWTLSGTRPLHCLVLDPQPPIKTTDGLMIHRRVVPVLKSRPLPLLHWSESCHPFRQTVKCLRRRPAVQEVLHRTPVPILSPATMAADSAYALVVKRKRRDRLALQLLNQKSIRVRVAIYHLPSHSK